jgi:putative endonuclease
MDKQAAACILASKRNGTLSVGVTSDLLARVWQHRNHAADGFTASHGVTNLVWYELHHTMGSAIIREKRIKKWRRAWKIELIGSVNPYWNDLWSGIVEGKDAGFPLSRE